MCGATLNFVISTVFLQRTFGLVQPCWRISDRTSSANLLPTLPASLSDFAFKLSEYSFFDNYKPGDVVRFGRDYKTIEAHKGETMRVVEFDKSRNVVVLEKANGVRLDWQAWKHTSVEVYESQQRPLAQGELIRFTRNTDEFKNGELARVVSISGDKANIEVGQGKAVRSHEINLEQHKHWDHAYASTVHAAQGATQHRAVFHIRAPEEASEQNHERALQAMARAMGDRSFYVASTRASHELSIYTNDKAGAAKAVTGRQDKSSAVELIQRHERQQLDQGYQR